MRSQFKKGLYKFYVQVENYLDKDEKELCVVYETMTSKKQADAFVKAFSVGLTYANEHLVVKSYGWSAMPDKWENL